MMVLYGSWVTLVDPNSDVCISVFISVKMYLRKVTWNINLKSHLGGKWVETDIDLIQ